MKKPMIFAILGVAALALILRFTMFGPSDEEQIQQALQEAIQASKEGRPGGVMDLLSSSLKLNEQEVGAGRDVARFIRDNKPEVSLSNTKPTISGDTAEIVSPVKVGIKILVQDMSFEIPNVRLEFRKERGTKWLVIPTPKWRLYKVTAPENAIPDIFRG